jgi:hypothetical protein
MAAFEIDPRNFFDARFNICVKLPKVQKDDIFCSSLFRFADVHPAIGTWMGADHGFIFSLTCSPCHSLAISTTMIDGATATALCRNFCACSIFECFSSQNIGENVDSPADIPPAPAIIPAQRSHAHISLPSWPNCHVIKKICRLGVEFLVYQNRHGVFRDVSPQTSRGHG